MNSKLFFVCLFVICSEISSDDFCKHFRAKRDRIGYTFRRDYNDEKANKLETKINIIIDGKCWELLFAHGSTPTLKLNQESKDCPLFGRFNFGLCLNTLKFTQTHICSAVLFNNDSTGIIAQIDNDKHDSFKEMSEYKKTKEITLTGNLPKEFVSVFQVDYDRQTQDIKGQLVFVSVDGQRLTGKLMDWEYNENTIKFEENTGDKIETHYTNFNGKQDIGSDKLFAVIYEYNDYGDKHDKNGLGHIFLFTKNGKISWCWTPRVKYECKALELLDCSKEPFPREPPPPSPEEEEGGSGWVIPVLIIVAIVVVILVIVIAVFLMKSRNEGLDGEPASSTVSAVPGDAAALSKRSQDVKGSKASAVGSKARTPSTAATSQTSKPGSPSGRSTKA